MRCALGSRVGQHGTSHPMQWMVPPGVEGTITRHSRGTKALSGGIYGARAGRYIYPVISSRDGCACGSIGYHRGELATILLCYLR